MRFRNVFIIFGCIMTLLLLVLTDPDSKLIQNLDIGSGPITTLVTIFKGILGTTILFFAGKGMMDYKVADFEELGKQAVRTPEGAGMYAIAVAIKWLALALVIGFAFNV